MGIPTLIKTVTSSNAATTSFVDGTSSVVLDGTYDEYMFVMTNYNSATDTANLLFNGSADTGSNYNVTKTTTFWEARHVEDDTSSSGYIASQDLAQSTDFQMLAYSTGNAADECVSGILHLFAPANTTYVKHFYWRGVQLRSDETCMDEFIAGYFNTTSAVDAIQFKSSTGNHDSIIQLYGIA